MIAEISTQLATHGLILRGGFAFARGEEVPAGAAGARAVLLVGHGGATIWPHFEAWRKAQPSSLDDPLDTWSRLVIGAVAEMVGARAVSPSDKPYLPFQQWAMRAEGLKPSPLGILMHPVFGLWHAYRGALLFQDEEAASEIRYMQRDVHPSVHPCDGCDGKPCLHACPVNAYSFSGFAYERCQGHVRSAAGTACRESGCLDRNACPYGATHRYDASQQAFHMRAFAPAAT